jgi:predicted permease
MGAVREWLQRLLGTLGRRRSDEDLQEELRLHLELEAAAAQRREPLATDATRRANVRVGGVAQAMDAVRDQRGLPRLESLIGDLVLAARQLRKRPTATAAAVLSLGLAMGATIAGFRLVDALLLRPLPVVDPGRLFAIAFDARTSMGGSEHRDDFDYPTFRRYREAAAGRADVMLIGNIARQEVVFGAGDRSERVHRQYFSGNVFSSLGLRPAAGRLLTPADDVTPRGHPLAVLSYAYWSSRFARDPNIIGTTFRIGVEPFEIIGVAPKGFTGTEPGRLADIFLPATMNWQALDRRGWSWFRIWVRPAAGVPAAEARQIFSAQLSSDRSANSTERTVDQVTLEPAGRGVSGAQRLFRLPLTMLSILVGLVLFIACVNVANVLTAQALARAREMALRVSIGAGRGRLIQLVLVESALLACGAAAVGALFAWWAAPSVLSLLSPLEDPVRLMLEPDWRVVAFGLMLTTVVTAVFGVTPALRASAIAPITAIRGLADPHPRRHTTHWLVGAQMAFCASVLFVTGLLVTTFANLQQRPLGFADDGLLLLETQLRGQPQPPQVWADVTARLGAIPGVESVASSMWAPLSGNGWSDKVDVPGRPPVESPSYFLGVSPGFFQTLRVAVIAGRDFQPADVPPTLDQRNQPVAGVGIVNESFARVYFGGRSPLGERVFVQQNKGIPTAMEIVGVVGDMSYRSVRDRMLPVVYVPNQRRNQAAIIVRTSDDPTAMASALREAVPQAHPDFRVVNVNTQRTLVARQMVGERLLAILSLFFAAVALLLAALGLYGCLNYAVVQQQRQIGIRMALGAHPREVLHSVMAGVSLPVLLGAFAGVGAGLLLGRIVDALLYEVKTTDAVMLASPIVVLMVAAVIAALPAAFRAVRTDPAQTLRNE